jgi:hypothetical protein
VEVSERFADGLATVEELRASQGEARVALKQAERDAFEAQSLSAEARAVARAHLGGARAAMRTAVGEALQDVVAVSPKDQRRLAAALRDIFGPFLYRSVSIEREWLQWNTGTIPKLAQAIYDDRAFHNLPILADALEEAGCDNLDILSHCRDVGDHIRGCWVIDLLLSKG